MNGHLFPCDEARMRSADAGVPCAPAARAWVLATTILASGMVFIDGTVANVALPALQREFGASAAQVQWVIESYALLLAALLLVGGSAGDRFGRRRVFALGIAVFAAASGWCALAPGIGQLVLARALQGAGGALLVPGSLALISASFPDELRGKAIGIWSGCTAITAAVGPVIGGALIHFFSWRYAFVINIPIALAVLWMAFRFVPESRGRQADGPLDWIGALLASIGLGGLVYALIEAPAAGLGAPLVAAAFATAVLALAAFLVVERRHPAPMLPLRLFHSRTFSGANLLTLLLYAALGGGLYFVPLNLIQVQGYSETAAGAALLPFILTMFLLSRWAGGLVDRHGPRLPLMIGPMVAAGGFLLFAVPGAGGSYWTTYMPAALVLGLGMTVTVAPLTATVMNALDRNLAGAASGINNAVSRVAALLAIALLGIVMSRVFDAALERRLRDAAMPAPYAQMALAQKARLGAIALPEEVPAAAREAIGKAVGDAFVEGFRRVMVICALLAVGSAVCAWGMIGRKG